MLCHFRHELLEDDLSLGVAFAYLGVVLGGDGLLQGLEAVEEAVGEVDEGRLVVQEHGAVAALRKQKRTRSSH